MASASAPPAVLSYEIGPVKATAFASIGTIIVSIQGESERTALYDAASQLLAASILALTGTTRGAPDRRYVSLGPPVQDCEQCVVWANPVTKWDTSPRNLPMDRGHHGRLSVNACTLNVWVNRCMKGGLYGGGIEGDPNAPDMALLDEDARDCYQDGWVLWNYIQQRVREGVLFGDPGMREVAFDQLSPLPPAGGIGGFWLTMTLTIAGYPAPV
jgi:hypothetical protein